jgi:mannose/cellobiose epimerase-like protein (N-acyl-D-glucosamine 2-epimerase family)
MNLPDGRNPAASSNGWQFPQAIGVEAVAVSDRLRQRFGAASFAYIHERRMVDQNRASWNQIAPWLKRLNALRLAA